MKSPRQLGGGFPDAQEAAPGSRCGRGPAPPPPHARTPAPPRWHCRSRHRHRHQRGARFGEQRLAVSDGAVQIVDSVGASIGAGFQLRVALLPQSPRHEVSRAPPPDAGFDSHAQLPFSLSAHNPSSACVTAAVCVVNFIATPFSGLLSFFPDQQLRSLRLICFSDRRFAADVSRAVSAGFCPLAWPAGATSAWR